MFRLREAHVAALNRVAETDMRIRIATYFRKEHPKRVLTLRDESLAHRIEVGIRRASRYGITGDTALMAYIGLMFEVAPNFDEHQTVQPFLRDETLEQDERIFRLLDAFSESSWEAVRSTRDMAAWESDVSE